MNLKQLSHSLKDLEEEKGIVVAYANAYDFKDSDGDISAKGSFDKTVNENFKRIRVLKNHNPREMVGVPLEIDTKDDFGLLTKSQFNMKTALGRDLFNDIKLMYDNGLNAELSIGYNIMRRDEKNKSIITEYKLMEYSFLTSWGANQLSTVQGFKNIKSACGILELIEKAYNLPYSDARLKQIENILKSIDTQNESPSEEDTIDFAPLTNIINNFKFN